MLEPNQEGSNYALAALRSSRFKQQKQISIYVSENRMKVVSGGTVSNLQSLVWLKLLSLLLLMSLLIQNDRVPSRLDVAR